MTEIIFKSINNKILQSDSILLVGHKNPDGDACGAILAMYIYISSLGKSVAAYVHDAPPSYFKYLPRYDEISHDAKVTSQKWNLVIIFDSSDWDHTGLLSDNFKDSTTVSMDHHFSNDGFADINCINQSVSSTCEIVYNFLTSIGADISRQIATCLLLGIISDTGGFSNGATTQESMKVAANLVSHGAKINQIAESVAKNKSIDGLRLWGLILSRLQINAKYNIAYTYIKEDELKQYRVHEEEIDGFVNFLNIIYGVRAAMFLHLSSNHTKISMRTTRDDIDLSQLAGMYGGGGHKKAAGFSVPWQIQDIDGILKVL
ncbi:MAG TPA: bifunctional oligoribonuclease/PAP phosphatase NrnA [Patescibacteria group bacterium]|nr:bifunctional oligoribonuclease/PAP phosphatase NrnA [Patescibacteria group bacterium]